MTDTTDLKGDRFDSLASRIVEQWQGHDDVVLADHKFVNLSDAIASALRASPWRYDMENAPRDGETEVDIALVNPATGVAIRSIQCKWGPVTDWTGREFYGWQFQSMREGTWLPYAWRLSDLPAPPEGEQG